MRIEIKLCKLKAHGQRTIIVTHHCPDWFMRFFFGASKTAIAYCGNGAKWYHYPSMEPLKWKRLEKELAEHESAVRRQRNK